jgi:hypothetical protein
MKTVSLLLICLVVGGLHAHAQGTIGYNNRVTGSVDARIYGPELLDPTVMKWGNTSSGTPIGSQIYTGVWLTGSAYVIQLWAGPVGSTADQLTLVPGSNRGLRTSTATGAAGLIDTTPGAEIEIPGVLLGQQAVLQLRVWHNQGGAVTSWNDARNNYGIYGASAAFTSFALGGGTTPAPNMVGLQSFNVIPEPSTFVLAGLVAAALMFIRRRK